MHNADITCLHRHSQALKIFVAGGFFEADSAKQLLLKRGTRIVNAVLKRNLSNKLTAAERAAERRNRRLPEKGARGLGQFFRQLRRPSARANLRRAAITQALQDIKKPPLKQPQRIEKPCAKHPQPAPSVASVTGTRMGGQSAGKQRVVVAAEKQSGRGKRQAIAEERQPERRKTPAAARKIARGTSPSQSGQAKSAGKTREPTAGIAKKMTEPEPRVQRRNREEKSPDNVAAQKMAPKKAKRDPEPRVKSALTSKKVTTRTPSAADSVKGKVRGVLKSGKTKNAASPERRNPPKPAKPASPDAGTKSRRTGGTHAAAPAKAASQVSSAMSWLKGKLGI